MGGSWVRGGIDMGGSWLVKNWEGMMEKIKSYKDLKIWKHGMELVKDIYSATGGFPHSEDYCLIAQMRRSAISIPSNISEGFLRHSTKEFVRFLYIALGSCGELNTQIEISRELGYMKDPGAAILAERIDRICRMIRNMIASLSIKRTATH